MPGQHRQECAMLYDAMIPYGGSMLERCIKPTIGGIL
jgi:hypothetical protein